MLYEYAIEPELVATWGDRRAGRYFADKFGLGSPRIVSRYPKRWKKLVWNAWERLETGNNEIDHARMTELIEQLSEAMVRRTNAVGNPDETWLNNTTEEHQRVPFHAILARRNSTGHAGILAADDLDERTPLWTAPRGVTISRNAAAIAGAVGNMLRIATDITFIDPYFAPHHRRFRNVMEACLKACLYERVGDPPRIRILSSDKTGADQKAPARRDSGRSESDDTPLEGTTRRGAIAQPVHPDGARWRQLRCRPGRGRSGDRRHGRLARTRSRPVRRALASVRGRVAGIRSREFNFDHRHASPLRRPASRSARVGSAA